MGMATKSLATLALTFSVAMSANAATYEAADDSAESKLCVAAATHSKVSMNQQVKRFVPTSSANQMAKNYKLIANNLYCNGIDIAEFAMQAGNKSVAKKLLKYRSKHVEITDIAKASLGKVTITGRS